MAVQVSTVTERTPPQGCPNHHQIRISCKSDQMFSFVPPLAREKVGAERKARLDTEMFSGLKQ